MSYNDYNEIKPTKTVGSFSVIKDGEFRKNFKDLIETMESTYSCNPIHDIQRVLSIDVMSEEYKNTLLEDVNTKGISDMNDPVYGNKREELEQLYENSRTELLQESMVAQLMPIVGLTPPILKKNYLECNAKDIVRTEIPQSPIINIQYERKFLKDADGKKYYIPDIYYNDNYKEMLDKGKGVIVDQTWQTLPLSKFNLLNASGGTLQARDTLGYDVGIKAIKVAGFPDPFIINAMPDYAAHNTLHYEFKKEDPSTPGTFIVDNLFAHFDAYTGEVDVGCSAGKITDIQFGGRLSNENNWRSLELDRERDQKQFKIPDGLRIDTGVTVERIKDMKALFDIDITTDIINDMSLVLTQNEDSEIFNHLDDAFEDWKKRTDLPYGYGDILDSFVEEFNFNCIPPSTIAITEAEYIAVQLKFRLQRLIDSLKTKLNTPDMMFVVYGHPNMVTLLQDQVRWVIDPESKIGGIQLNYQFGILSATQDRIHVVSTMKFPAHKGFRVVAYPLTNDTYTFRHFKYSLNIENTYRNAATPLIPNIMGTSRYLTTHLLPIQGSLRIYGDGFGNQRRVRQNLVATLPATATPEVIYELTADDGTRLMGTRWTWDATINDYAQV